MAGVEVWYAQDLPFGTELLFELIGRLRVAAAQALHLESPRDVKLDGLHLTSGALPPERCSIEVVITAPDQETLDPEAVAAYVTQHLGGLLIARGKHRVSLRVTAAFVRSGSVRFN